MLKRVAILALLGVSLASAKTYTFTVTDPAQAGKSPIEAGRVQPQIGRIASRVDGHVWPPH